MCKSYIWFYENTKSEDGYVEKVNDSMSCVKSFSLITTENSLGLVTERRETKRGNKTPEIDVHEYFSLDRSLSRRLRTVTLQ